MPESNTEVLSILRQISETNASWTAAETTIMRLPPEERRRRLGYIPGPDEESLEQREQRSRANAMVALTASASATPSAIDWRNVGGYNYVTSVKDQGSCGSCVAFGTASTMESAERILAGIPVNGVSPNAIQDLSEAQLFYCGTTNACNIGWYVGSALSFATNPGVVPESCFPYTAGNQACNPCSNWQSQVTQLNLSHWISNVADMKTWLATRGPLIACFSVYADFYSYSGGVYTHTSGALEGGHCVSCIGYSDSLGAWLCKNSWGTGWGMNGYFWIAYGQCGIDSSMAAIDNFTTMYPLYNDLFTRANLSSVGVVPQQGSPSASPDIIPYGTQPVADPQQFFTTNYNADPGKNLEGGQYNYIYLRARNLSSSAANGTAYMYYSKASLLLWPSLWSQNQLQTSQNNGSTTISAPAQGAIAVATDPFLWSPAPISDDHYCLVSRISTTAHPNPIPADFSSMDQFAQYVLANPGVGWRNVSVVDFNNAPSLQLAVNLTCPIATPLYILLDAVNLPTGTSVAFSCGTSGPQPPINLPQTQVTSTSFVTGVLSNVPANFSSSIIVSFWRNGLQVPAGASLTLYAGYPVTSDNALAQYAVDDTSRLASAVKAADTAAASAGAAMDATIGPTRMVTIGQYSIFAVGNT